MVRLSFSPAIARRLFIALTALAFIALGISLGGEDGTVPRRPHRPVGMAATGP